MTSPAVANSPTLPDCEPRQLLADLFHALSQPLTTLCCSLELTLQQATTVEEYRESVTRALDDAERVSWLSTGIRELLEAGQAGEDCESLQLRVAVQSAVGDLLPVAESAGRRICYLPSSDGPVWFDAQRLRQGLFHLLGFAVGAGRPGAEVRIEVAEAGEEVGLTVSCKGRALVEDQLERRLGLGIARAIFEAAGGSFRVEQAEQGWSVAVRIARAGTE